MKNSHVEISISIYVFSKLQNLTLFHFRGTRTGNNVFMIECSIQHQGEIEYEQQRKYRQYMTKAGSCTVGTIQVSGKKVRSENVESGIHYDRVD